MTQHLERAMLLLDQSRYELAEKELRQQLVNEPSDPLSHALLAQCLVHQERFAEATEEAKLAVSLGPDLPLTYSALADVLYRRNDLEEAEEVIGQAIEMDPSDADHRALLAAIRFDQRRWPESLEAAEEGLELDPEHISCNNFRAMALVKLGRRAEAGETIDSALARDPDNAVTHANQGWTLLEKGDTLKALEHFREALRLDPELDWARQGVLEALKSRYPVYRFILMYFLWMAKLSRQAQWGVIVGAYFGYQAMNYVAESNPTLSPWLQPLLWAYIVFVVMTWIADPLLNLVLRLNRFGRMVLSRDEIVASNWVGLCLLAALAAFGWALWHGGSAWQGATIVGLLVLPVAGTFKCPVGARRTIAAFYTLALVLAGPGGFALYLFGSSRPDDHTDWLHLIALIVGATAMIAFFVGVLCFSFLVNALIMMRQRR